MRFFCYRMLRLTLVLNCFSVLVTAQSPKSLCAQGNMLSLEGYFTDTEKVIAQGMNLELENVLLMIALDDESHKTGAAWIGGITALLCAICLLWPRFNRALLIRSVKRDFNAHRPYYNRAKIIAAIAGSIVVVSLGCVWAIQGFGPLVVGEYQKMRSNVAVVTYHNGREVSRETSNAPIVAIGLIGIIFGIAGCGLIGGGIWMVVRVLIHPTDLPLEIDDYVWLTDHFSRKQDYPLMRDLADKGIVQVGTKIEFWTEVLQNPMKRGSDFEKLNAEGKKEYMKKLSAKLQQLRDKEQLLKAHLTTGISGASAPCTLVGLTDTPQK